MSQRSGGSERHAYPLTSLPHAFSVGLIDYRVNARQRRSLAEWQPYHDFAAFSVVKNAIRPSGGYPDIAMTVQDGKSIAIHTSLARTRGGSRRRNVK